MIDTITNVQNKLFPHVFIKKFFILKNAAALRTLFFETCNCSRFRAISYVIKKATKKQRSFHTLFSCDSKSPHIYEIYTSAPSSIEAQTDCCFITQLSLIKRKTCFLYSGETVHILLFYKKNFSLSIFFWKMHRIKKNEM